MKSIVELATGSEAEPSFAAAYITAQTKVDRNTILFTKTLKSIAVIKIILNKAILKTRVLLTVK